MHFSFGYLRMVKRFQALFCLKLQINTEKNKKSTLL